MHNPLLRFLLWLGLSALMVFLLFGFFLQIMIAASNRPTHGMPFTTNIGAWAAFTAMILLSFSLITTVLICLTFMADAEQKRKWRTFWNVVEVLWLVGTGLGIFGLISASSVTLKAMITEEFQLQMNEEEKQVSDLARNVFKNFCEPKQRSADICHEIEPLMDLSSHPPLRPDAAWNFGILIAQYKNAHPKESVSELNSLQRSFFENREEEFLVSREPLSVVVPLWSRWVAIFTPWIFAFVFPIKFGRAVTAFCL